MSLAATTVSIVLTFGTSAIIDRKRKNDEKRQMVMTMLFDMRETLNQMERCDGDLNAFFDAQVEALAHPGGFAGAYVNLAAHIPYFEYTSTAENIFKFNVETVYTIGNILFVETASTFYEDRVHYKEEVVKTFQSEAFEAIESYDALAAFNSARFPFLSQAFLSRMKGVYEQCKLMMKVTDKDLEIHSTQLQKLMESMQGKEPADAPSLQVQEMTRRNAEEDLHIYLIISYFYFTA